MATKKQKREAAEAKRKEFEARLKADGLAAQERDKQIRANQRAQIQAAFRGESQRMEAILAGERGPRCDYAIFDEMLAPARVPFKDKPGGKIIGYAEVERAEDGIRIKAELDVPVIPFEQKLAVSQYKGSISMERIRDGATISQDWIGVFQQLKPSDIRWKLAQELRRQDEELIREDIEEQFEPDFDREW